MLILMGLLINKKNTQTFKGNQTEITLLKLNRINTLNITRPAIYEKLDSKCQKVTNITKWNMKVNDTQVQHLIQIS